MSNANDIALAGLEYSDAINDTAYTGAARLRTVTFTAPSGGARTFTVYDGTDTDGDVVISVLLQANEMFHANLERGIKVSTGIHVGKAGGLFGTSLVTWRVE